jgi:uncharacterized protein
MDTNVKFETIRIPVMPEVQVTGVVATPEWWPSGQRIGLVIAHDATGGKDEPTLVAMQQALSAKGHLTLRFAFPFAEDKKKRPDPPNVLDRAFRAAVQAVVSQGLKVDALFSLGFPLHPSGKPSHQDVDYMYRIICPMLFVQGARDPHCRIDKLEELLRRIGAPTRLHVIADCGPGLEPVKKTGRTAEQIRAEALAQIERYVQEVIGRT